MVTFSGFVLEVRDSSGKYTICSEVGTDTLPIYTAIIERRCSAIGDVLKYKRTTMTYESHKPQMAYLCEVLIIGRERIGELYMFDTELLAFYVEQL